MRILNLYAGIGGNRLAFGNKHEVTAYEIVPEIAEEYQRLFPNDRVIVGDAHEALLKEIDNGYDFIWSSPPCQTHSMLVYSNWKKLTYKRRFPDMRLYEEIMVLQRFIPPKSYFCVENVIPYHHQLIQPSMVIGRHCFWCNYPLRDLHKDFGIEHRGLSKNEIAERKGIDVNITATNKRLLFRNACNRYIAEHIFQCLPNPERTLFGND